MLSDLQALQRDLDGVITEAVIVTDREDRVVLWGPAAEGLLGLTCAEAIGRRLPELLRDLGNTLQVRSTTVEGADDNALTVLTVRSRDAARKSRSRLARLAAAVEAIPEAVLVVDVPDGVVTHVNAAACSLFQQPPAGLVGSTMAKLFPSDGWAELAELLPRLDSDERGSARFGYDATDGIRVELAVSVQPIKDPTGSLDAVLVVATNVTAESRAREELRSSEARWRALVAHSSDTALVTDAERVVTYISPAVRGLLGYEPAEVVGTPGLHFVHPDDTERAQRFVDVVLATPGPHPLIELRARTRSGHYVWIEALVSNLLHDPDVQGLVMNLRDVTQRRLASEALAASEARYRSMVEGAEEGLWVLGPEHLTTFVNARLARMLEVSPDSMLGRSPLDFVHPDDAAGLGSQLERRRSGNNSRYECRFVTASGSTVHVLVSGHPLTATDGSYAGVQGMLTDITDLHETREALRRLAVRDELTGLPNRTLFSEQVDLVLATQRREQTLVAVVYVDLGPDHAVVGDSMGHLCADQMLTTVAERLQDAIRSEDMLSHFGHGVFAVVCPDLTDRKEAEHVAQRIQGAVAAPFSCSGEAAPWSPQIGIAFGPAETAPDLIRDAGAAAHQAARVPGGCIETFSDHLQERLLLELATVHDLRTALVAGDQLTLFYQPVLGLPSERAVGVEALVRWRHPTRGLLPPDAFVGLAERHGLIRELDKWALYEATAALARWRASGLVAEEFDLAVNISGAHYADDSLVDEVRHALAVTGLPPDRLILEVTETAVVTDVQAAITVLGRLKALGIRLAIDDFGTGFSSLTYLRSFPVDILKIDRSFVSGVPANHDDVAIVSSTISLARAVGMTCIAEGVETEDQLWPLVDAHCEAAQGYLWSRPVCEDELPDALAAGTAHARRRLVRSRNEPNGSPSSDPKVRRQIVEMHHRGASLQTIAAALNSHGFRTDRDARWRAATVARVIAHVDDGRATAG